MSYTPVIGFDAKRIVRNGTGLGSYGRTLVNDLSKFPLTLRLYAPDEGRADLRNQVSNKENIVFSVRKYHFLGKKTMLSGLGNAFWRSRGILKDLQCDGVQLFHGLSGELPFGISKSGIKTVVTIHDLIFLRHPEFYNPIDVQIYKWKFRRTLREASHIIAISECTKRDILEFGGPLVSPDRITLIYQSCSPRFSVLPSDGNHSPLLEGIGRYILCVGSIEPRKNAMLALQALHHLPSDISLVLVGRHTVYTDKLRTYADAHGLSQRLVILHGVADTDLPALYAGADVFVYPSVYEGFGIPIIEAISCGLPVVACTGSCLEEAGGPDCFYVSPTDVDGMAHAIQQNLKGTEGREARIQRSMEYIRRFSGHNVAEQVVQLYKQLLY